MRIIGIDPGTVITGWGVVEAIGSTLNHVAHGTIATAGGREQGMRLSRIYRDVEAVIETYRPAGISIERVFFARNAQSALKLGQARGVVLLAAALHQAAVYEYAAAEIKSAVVGYGQATKEQVQMMVASLLRLPQRPPLDAADALAAAICHLHRQVFQARLAEARPNKRLIMLKKTAGQHARGRASSRIS
ncbi:MAG TPA: crossover junction endodeoxyribonuclease RuvC [Terriglobales bacterium]|nr:crossover junction endodeoxyribonuclease RuvC [Terriglobales bacterium]